MEENKPKTNNTLSIILFIIIVALLGAVAYMVTSQNPMDTQTQDTQTQEENTTQEDTTTQPDTTVEDEADTTQTDTTTTTTVTTETTKIDTTEYKTQIDKDLQSLDGLDLSSPENDFGDDKMSDY